MGKITNQNFFQLKQPQDMKLLRSFPIQSSGNSDAVNFFAQHEVISTPKLNMFEGIQQLNYADVDKKETSVTSSKEADKSSFGQQSNRPSASNFLTEHWNTVQNEDGSYSRVNQNGDSTINYDSSNQEISGEMDGKKFTTEANSDGTFVRKFEDGTTLNYDKNGRETGGTDSEGRKFSSTSEGNVVTRHYAGNEQTIIKYDGDGTKTEETIIKSDGKQEVLRYSNGKLVSGYDEKFGEYTVTERTNSDGTRSIVRKSKDKNCCETTVLDKNGLKLSVITTSDNGRRVDKFENGIITEAVMYWNEGVRTVVKYENGEKTHSTVAGPDFHIECSYYKDREDGLTEEVTSVENGEQKITRNYEGREDGLLREEIIIDKNGNKIIERSYTNNDVTIEESRNGVTVSSVHRGDEIVAGEYFNESNGVSIQTHYDANGIFDKPISQNETGDCWLLAGLESIMMRPEGREYLESLVQFDDKTGDAVVTLPGVGRKFKVTREEMENAGFLATGDGDIRIFELAMHKLLAGNPEYHYKLEEDNGMTIEGNWPVVIYDAIMPKPNQTQYQDKAPYRVNSFNNENVAVSATFPEFEGQKTDNGETIPEDIYGIGPNGEPIKIIGNHAYAVHHSDSQYVYLQNPWDKFDPNNPEASLIKMSIEDFNKYCDSVTTRKLNYPKSFVNRPKPEREPSPSVTATFSDDGFAQFLPELNINNPKFKQYIDMFANESDNKSVDLGDFI